MGKSKIVYGDETLIDLTGDSVSPQTMLAGATAHDAAGEAIEGAVVVAPIDDAPTEGSGNAVSSGGVYAALQSAGGLKSYYQEFAAADWADDTTEATLTIAAATHGLSAPARCIQRFWTLTDGALVSGAWADATAYTTADSAGNIILHASEAFAGAVMLVG